MLRAAPPARSTGGELLRWAVVAIAVVAAGYLAAATTAFWVWVANSAFRGIREEQDIGLGLICVGFVVAPVAGSVVAYRYRRSARSSRRGIGRAAATMLGLQTVSFVCGVVASGPF